MLAKATDHNETNERKSSDTESGTFTPLETDPHDTTMKEKNAMENPTKLDRRISQMTVEQEKPEDTSTNLRKTSTTESQIVYPTGVKLALITLALALAIFLVALVSSYTTDS